MDPGDDLFLTRNRRRGLRCEMYIASGFTLEAMPQAIRLAK